MTTKFCPKCKSILIPKKGKAHEYLFCKICGYESRKKSDLKSKEKIPKKEFRKEGVVKDKNIFATYPNKCKKCGYNKAEIINQGVKYSDEESSVLLRCGKCGWSKQLGEKIS